MLDVTKSLPEDPAELRAFTALLLAEVKSQAVLIEKLRHTPLRTGRRSPGATMPTARDRHMSRRFQLPQG